MRTGKRTLAGIAAVGLGAALIPFVGVGGANAAVTSVTKPSAVRAAVATAATGYAINGTVLGDSTSDAYVFSMLSGTQFGSIANAGGSNRPNVAGTLVQPGAVTYAAGNAGLTPTVGVYKATNDDPGNEECTFTALGATGVAPTATPSGASSCAVTLVGTFSQAVGGAIANIAIAPASATVVVGGTQAYAVTATDTTGRPTLTDAGDSITAVSSNPAVATAGALVVSGDSMSITATGVAAGNTTITAVPQNAAVSSASAGITVTANGATSASTDVQVPGSNILPNSTVVGARTYFANPALTSFTFNVSGLTPGADYLYTVAGTATPTPTGGTVTASASGTATVAVSTATQVNAQTVVFTVVDNGGAGNKTATVTYQTAALEWVTPENNGAFFGTASGTVDIPAQITDQYGNPAVSAVLTLTDGGGTVDTKLTDATGSATLVANVPATGSTAYTLTPTGSGAGAGAINFTVFAGTPTVAITGGVSTNGATVTVPSWTDAAVVQNADATNVTLSVQQNNVGVDGATVTVTGGDGVLLFAAAPGGAAFGTGETSLTLTTAGGGLANFWATTSLAGTAMVSVESGGASASGEFTGGAAAAAAARNVMVEAPASVEAGGFGVVTIMATDNFGNPVSGATVNAAFDNASPGFFGGGGRQLAVLTGAGGIAQVTVGAGINEIGDMLFSVGTGGTQQFSAEADRLTSASVADDAVGYTASNAPEPVTVEITPGPASQSILILDGYRNGQRIETFGESTGFGMGAFLKPYIRFPGQTGFTMGTADILVDEFGDWNWGRKTGKRTAVQIRDMDNTVRSNTVIIPAR